jgi:glycosyltransferase involved in cell wall biosynthesis
LQQELEFTLLLQPHNQGKGAALRRGFEAVRGDLVVIQDADLEYSPEEFPC